MAFDYFGDVNGRVQGYLLGNIHYYFIDQQTISSKSDKNIMFIPPISDVISINYIPYVDKNDLSYDTVTFNSDRYPIKALIKGGNTSTLYDEGTVDFNDLYRLRSINALTKNIGSSFSRYGVTGTSIGGKFKWQNEGKLWLAPYRYIEFNDHITTPLRIDPQFLDKNTTPRLKGTFSVNPYGMYTLWVDGYKGDTSGLYEGVVCANLNMPCSSNSYLDYMSRNQNTFKLNRVQSFVSGASQVVGGVAGAFTGNIGGGVSSVVNGMMSPLSSYASERDMLNTPDTIRSTGADITHNMQVQGGMYMYRIGVIDEHLERLGWFFHMYGYKQNKVMTPMLRTRARYNYIKTNGLNVRGNGVHKDHLNKIKQIFNNGVRIWHVTNANVTVGDYSIDNEES